MPSHHHMHSRQVFSKRHQHQQQQQRRRRRRPPPRRCKRTVKKKRSTRTDKRVWHTEEAVSLRLVPSSVSRFFGGFFSCSLSRGWMVKILLPFSISPQARRSDRATKRRRYRAPPKALCVCRIAGTSQRNTYPRQRWLCDESEKHHHHYTQWPRNDD